MECWALPLQIRSARLPPYTSRSAAAYYKRWQDGSAAWDIRPSDHCRAVPVQGWRATGCMKGLDWSCLRCYRYVNCCWVPSCTSCLHSHTAQSPPPWQQHMGSASAWFPAVCARATFSTSALRCSYPLLCSSTGEASAPDDYLWLMARAGYKPVIEYCGGGWRCWRDCLMLYAGPALELALPSAVLPNLHACGEATACRCI